MVVYSGPNTYTASVPLVGIADLEWHYTCVDIYVDSLRTVVAQNAAVLNRVKNIFYFSKDLFHLFNLKASFPTNVGNVLVDALTVRRYLPIGFQDQDSLKNRRLFPSLQISPSSLNVTKTSNSSLTISYRTTNCSYNLDLVSVRQDISSVILNSFSIFLSFVKIYKLNKRAMV